jgi:hypothetical protein
MYLCRHCGNVFEEPGRYTETHGLDYPPYEEYYGCPICGGAYIKTMECCDCGEWITGKYIKLSDGTVFCDICYDLRDVLDD